MEKIYFDDFKNKATITKTKILAYYGATEKTDAYILKCYALYDNNINYHTTIHETEEDAINKLKSFSCGTFKQIKNSF